MNDSAKYLYSHCFISNIFNTFRNYILYCANNKVYSCETLLLSHPFLK